MTTVNGGTASKASAFAIGKNPAPAITAVTPASGYRGTAISFVIDGSNFQPGGRTTANLTRAGQSEIPITLSAVYKNRIIGTVLPPADTVTGYWNVNVTTVDGGRVTKTSAVNIL